MTDKKSILIFLLYFLIFISLSNLVRANLFAELLSPFESTDISSIYDSYSSIIDFIIYLVLFMGLSQATIGRHFKSRGGKAMVVAIGFVLAIGLAASESYLGFNLRSFGPLAATIFIFLFGLVLFLGIKSVGMEVVGSVSISLVLVYFSIRSVAPNFFDWMAANQYLSWLHSIILIAVVISIYKIIRFFFPKKDETGESNRAKKFSDISSKSKDFLSEIKEENEGKKLIRKSLEKITSESGKNSKQIIEDCEDIKIFIKEYGNSEKGRQLIAKKVSSLITIEKQIHQKFISLDRIVKQFSNLDIQEFQNLSKPYNNLPPEDQKRIDKALKLEWKNLDVERQMIKLEESINKYDNLFTHQLQLLIQTLKANKINKAIISVDRLIKVEKTIQAEIQLLDKLQHKITTFSNSNIIDLINC